MTNNDNDRFHASCMTRVSNSAIIGGMGGLLIGGTFLSWYPDPFQFGVKGTVVPFKRGIAHVWRGLQKPVVWGTVVCTIYSGVECIMEQLRDENHESTWVNSTVAGAAAGMVMGSMTRRFDIMSTTALGVGILMGMIEYNGSSPFANKPRAVMKWHGFLPAVTADSTTVMDLKKKYPEFEDI